MNLDISHFELTRGVNSVNSENANVNASPAKEEYKKELAQTLMETTAPSNKVLAFQHKARQPPLDHQKSLRVLYTHNRDVSGLPRKYSRHIPQTPERILDAPELLDDYYLNLLDWSSNNVLAVALGDSIYLWNATDGSIQQLMQTQGEQSHVTSLSWIGQGNSVAVGTSDHKVQIWDVERLKQVWAAASLPSLLLAVAPPFPSSTVVRAASSSPAAFMDLAPLNMRSLYAGAPNGRASSACVVPFLERSTSLLWWARLPRDQSRRARGTASCLDAPRAHAGSLWAQVVAFGYTAGFRGKRQSAQHLGRTVCKRRDPAGLRSAAASARRPPGRCQGDRVVPMAEESARIGRRHSGPHDPLLELELGGLPQRGGHALASLRAPVVRARQGARLLPRLLAQPAHPLEVGFALKTTSSHALSDVEEALRDVLPPPAPHPPNMSPRGRYPSMVKVAELTGHTSRVLHMAQSPDGTTVVTAAADETLRFWKILSGMSHPRSSHHKPKNCRTRRARGLGAVTMSMPLKSCSCDLTRRRRCIEEGAGSSQGVPPQLYVDSLGSCPRLLALYLFYGSIRLQRYVRWLFRLSRHVLERPSAPLTLVRFLWQHV
jgi:WD40 repeat protein